MRVQQRKQRGRFVEEIELGRVRPDFQARRETFNFYGGEGEIRTPDTVARMPHFECGAFNHSATSPGAKSGPDAPRGRGRVIGEDGWPDKAAGKKITRLLLALGAWLLPPLRPTAVFPANATVTGAKDQSAGRRVGPPYANTHWRSRAASLQCRPSKEVFAGRRDATISRLSGDRRAATRSCP